jgi:hypothetical protein
MREFCLIVGYLLVDLADALLIFFVIILYLGAQRFVLLFEVGYGTFLVVFVLV